MSSGRLITSLSLVFGCLLLVLVAQVYYFLWWKKRKTHLDIEKGPGNYAKGLFHWWCWKTHYSKNGTIIPRSVTKDPETTIHETETTSDEAKLELSAENVSEPKSFGEESVESELMRMHNLAGPPRFLFTIIEEVKEDLESEDGKSKGPRTSNLSDVMSAIDTPFYTPVSSSPSKGPLDSLHSYQHQGFNPLFELSEESEFNRFRSSPPPKFKFLRDAEEKFHRKLIEEAKRKALENHESVPEYGVTDHSDGSFFRIIQNEDTERKQLQQYLPQIPSSSSQVLPLTSSPTTFRPLEKASMVH